MRVTLGGHIIYILYHNLLDFCFIGWFNLTLHPLSIASFARQKYVKNINIKRDLDLLKFQMCIEMIGNVNFRWISIT